MQKRERYGNDIGLARESRSISFNEYELWQEFRKGDLAAYAAIYRQYFFVLHKYGNKVCKDPELIKDAIQDLFIKIWNNRENLQSTTSIKYYLFTSLKRKLLDMMETPHIKYATQRGLLDDDIIELADTLEDENHPPQKEKVLAALNRLSKHQQKLLKLKFYENRSSEEIAQEFGITIQSVYNAVFKALRSIRKQMTTVIVFILSFLFV